MVKIQCKRDNKGTPMKHTPPPEPENVGSQKGGASHKRCRLNEWDPSEMIWCLETYNK